MGESPHSGACRGVPLSRLTTAAHPTSVDLRECPAGLSRLVLEHKVQALKLYAVVHWPLDERPLLAECVGLKPVSPLRVGPLVQLRPTAIELII